MREYIFKCDFCGKTVNNEDEIHDACIAVLEDMGDEYEDEELATSAYYDVCDDCLKLIDSKDLFNMFFDYLKAKRNGGS